MKLEGHQRRLSIFIGKSDRHGHTPLATEIVHRARKTGLAGATVFSAWRATARRTTSTPTAFCC